ncbi:PREDICTED: tectonic [Drosophila arizonae]|uniref:Tectonic n=1 Tax=Drosophila arizonae TaxID=7263 RepID=A0ABM1NWX7_DROAR|nr:PREDICTED: tectonic [Drosophila arizonae]
MLHMNILTTLAVLGICLLSAPMQCIKIGVSRGDNTTAATTPLTSPATTTTTTTAATTATTSTTTEFAATTTAIDNYDLDMNTTFSSLIDAVTTPSQTFPPRRKASKPRTTAAPTQPTTPAVAATANSFNASTAPASASPRKDTSFYYCSCDLRQDLCEVNCCCDRDCSQESLQVFSCLPEQHTRLEDFQYNHGLPTCQISDGWLCVFRSHAKPAKMQTPSQNFDSKDYNRWPEQLDAFETALPAPPTTSHYKFGQALQLWQPESKSLANWELPMAYESTSCQLKQTLLYLQPMESSCLLADATQLQMNLWSLLNLTNSHQLLSRPRELEEQQVHGLNITICQQLLLQPKIQCLERNETQSELLVDRIELQLLHNYTSIVEAKLLLREANVEDDKAELWLTYALVYQSVEELNAKPSSGALGYELGAPLLLAMLPSENNSKPELLNYYQSQNESSQVNQHWLMPCSQSLEQRHAVSFGIDLTKQCQLRHLSPVPGHENNTDYCQQLQLAIWRQLLPPNCTQLEQVAQLVFVSQLGRPQLDKWLPLQLSYADGQPHQTPIQVTYDAQHQTLSCRNMWLSVSYEFYVSELALLDGRVPHQSVLQHARLVLGQRHDLEFDAAEQHIQLPLAVSVMFFKAQNKLHNNSNNLIALDSHLIFISLIILMIPAQRFQLS